MHLRAANARRGMVTAPHHLAAQSGLGVLRDGGNAIEAMVAAAATIAVVYPHMNGIGGDGFWLIGWPGRAPVGIEACGRAAAGATAAAYVERGFNAIPTRGPLAALTVAGALSGWNVALRLGGVRLPLSRLLADAIAYARDGFAVTASQVAYTERFLDELAPQPGFAQAFLHSGTPHRPGALLKSAALATTLEQLARRGLEDFYTGELARAVADELGRLGSPLRAEDLARHAATIVEPLSLELAPGIACNMPPPTQGVAALMILGIFDRLSEGVDADGVDYVHRLVESTKQALRWRNRAVGDPTAMTIAAGALLHPDELTACARAVDPARAAPWPEPSPRADTVWMGAVDGDGCMVSYIQSVYWEFGSGVVLGDTGIHWQNRGAAFSLDSAALQHLVPGRRPFHTLNPALARLRDGRLMVYGTMGGDGQPQTQAAVFSRYAMYGQDLQQAVNAPRWLLGRTWGDMSVSLKLESRFDASLVRALADMGHQVELIEPWSDLVGHAGALVRHADGLLEGAADPRADGGVATW